MDSKFRNQGHGLQHFPHGAAYATNIQNVYGQQGIQWFTKQNIFRNTGQTVQTTTVTWPGRSQNKNTLSQRIANCSRNRKHLFKTNTDKKMYTGKVKSHFDKRRFNPFERTGGQFDHSQHRHHMSQSSYNQNKVARNLNQTMSGTFCQQYSIKQSSNVGKDARSNCANLSCHSTERNQCNDNDVYNSSNRLANSTQKTVPFSLNKKRKSQNTNTVSMNGSSDLQEKGKPVPLEAHCTFLGGTNTIEHSDEIPKKMENHKTRVTDKTDGKQTSEKDNIQNLGIANDSTAYRLGAKETDGYGMETPRPKKLSARSQSIYYEPESLNSQRLKIPAGCLQSDDSEELAKVAGRNYARYNVTPDGSFSQLSKQVNIKRSNGNVSVGKIDTSSKKVEQLCTSTPMVTKQKTVKEINEKSLKNNQLKGSNRYGTEFKHCKSDKTACLIEKGTCFHDEKRYPVDNKENLKYERNDIDRKTERNVNIRCEKESTADIENEKDMSGYKHIRLNSGEYNLSSSNMTGLKLSFEEQLSNVKQLVGENGHNRLPFSPIQNINMSVSSKKVKFNDEVIAVEKDGTLSKSSIDDSKPYRQKMILIERKRKLMKAKYKKKHLKSSASLKHKLEMDTKELIKPVKSVTMLKGFRIPKCNKEDKMVEELTLKLELAKKNAKENGRHTKCIKHGKEEKTVIEAGVLCSEEESVKKNGTVKLDTEPARTKESNMTSQSKTSKKRTLNQSDEVVTYVDKGLPSKRRKCSESTENTGNSKFNTEKLKGKNKVLNNKLIRKPGYASVAQVDSSRNLKDFLDILNCFDNILPKPFVKEKNEQNFPKSKENSNTCLTDETLLGHTSEEKSNKLDQCDRTKFSGIKDYKKEVQVGTNTKLTQGSMKKCFTGGVSTYSVTKGINKDEVEQIRPCQGSDQLISVAETETNPDINKNNERKTRNKVIDFPESNKSKKSKSENFMKKVNKHLKEKQSTLAIKSVTSSSKERKEKVNLQRQRSKAEETIDGQFRRKTQALRSKFRENENKSGSSKINRSRTRSEQSQNREHERQMKTINSKNSIKKKSLKDQFVKVSRGEHTIENKRISNKTDTQTKITVGQGNHVNSSSFCEQTDDEQKACADTILCEKLGLFRNKTFTDEQNLSPARNAFQLKVKGFHMTNNSRTRRCSSNNIRIKDHKVAAVKKKLNAKTVNLLEKKSLGYTAPSVNKKVRETRKHAFENKVTDIKEQVESDKMEAIISVSEIVGKKITELRAQTESQTIRNYCNRSRLDGDKVTCHLARDILKQGKKCVVADNSGDSQEVKVENKMTDSHITGFPISVLNTRTETVKTLENDRELNGDIAEHPRISQFSRDFSLPEHNIKTNNLRISDRTTVYTEKLPKDGMPCSNVGRSMDEEFPCLNLSLISSVGNTGMNTTNESGKHDLTQNQRKLNLSWEEIFPVPHHYFKMKTTLEELSTDAGEERFDAYALNTHKKNVCDKVNTHKENVCDKEMPCSAVPMEAGTQDSTYRSDSNNDFYCSTSSASRVEQNNIQQLDMHSNDCQLTVDPFIGYPVSHPDLYSYTGEYPYPAQRAYTNNFHVTDNYLSARHVNSNVPCYSRNEMMVECDYTPYYQNNTCMFQNNPNMYQYNNGYLGHLELNRNDNYSTPLLNDIQTHNREMLTYQSGNRNMQSGFSDMTTSPTHLQQVQDRPASTHDLDRTQLQGWNPKVPYMDVSFNETHTSQTSVYMQSVIVQHKTVNRDTCDEGNRNVNCEVAKHAEVGESTESHQREDYSEKSVHSATSEEVGKGSIFSAHITTENSEINMVDDVGKFDKKCENERNSNTHHESLSESITLPTFVNLADKTGLQSTNAMSAPRYNSRESGRKQEPSASCTTDISEETEMHTIAKYGNEPNICPFSGEHAGSTTNSPKAVSSAETRDDTVSVDPQIQVSEPTSNASVTRNSKPSQRFQTSAVPLSNCNVDPRVKKRIKYPLVTLSPLKMTKDLENMIDDYIVKNSTNIFNSSWLPMIQSPVWSIETPSISPRNTPDVVISNMSPPVLSPIALPNNLEKNHNGKNRKNKAERRSKSLKGILPTRQFDREKILFETAEMFLGENFSKKSLRKRKKTSALGHKESKLSKKAEKKNSTEEKKRKRTALKESLGGKTKVTQVEEISVQNWRKDKERTDTLSKFKESHQNKAETLSEKEIIVDKSQPVCLVDSTEKNKSFSRKAVLKTEKDVNDARNNDVDHCNDSDKKFASDSYKQTKNIRKGKKKKTRVHATEQNMEIMLDGKCTGDTNHASHSTCFPEQQNESLQDDGRHPVRTQEKEQQAQIQQASSLCQGHEKSKETTFKSLCQCLVASGAQKSAKRENNKIIIAKKDGKWSLETSNASSSTENTDTMTRKQTDSKYQELNSKEMDIESINADKTNTFEAPAHLSTQRSKEVECHDDLLQSSETLDEEVKRRGRKGKQTWSKSKSSSKHQSKPEGNEITDHGKKSSEKDKNCKTDTAYSVTDTKDSNDVVDRNDRKLKENVKAKGSKSEKLICTKEKGDIKVVNNAAKKNPNKVIESAKSEETKYENAFSNSCRITEIHGNKTGSKDVNLKTGPTSCKSSQENENVKRNKNVKKSLNNAKNDKELVYSAKGLIDSMKCKAKESQAKKTARAKEEDLKSNIKISEHRESCSIDKTVESLKTKMKTNLKKYESVLKEKCLICNEGFATRTVLSAHMLTCHPYRCIWCKVEFDSKKASKDHYYTHMKTTYFCKPCNTRYGNPSMYGQHLKSKKHEQMVKKKGGSKTSAQVVPCSGQQRSDQPLITEQSGAVEIETITEPIGHQVPKTSVAQFYSSLEESSQMAWCSFKVSDNIVELQYGQPNYSMCSNYGDRMVTGSQDFIDRNNNFINSQCLNEPGMKQTYNTDVQGVNQNMIDNSSTFIDNGKTYTKMTDVKILTSENESQSSTDSSHGYTEITDEDFGIIGPETEVSSLCRIANSFSLADFDQDTHIQ